MTALNNIKFFAFRDSNNKVIKTVGNTSSKTSQVFTFSAALLDKDGNVPTVPLFQTIQTVDGKTEDIYIKENGLTTDGTQTKDTFVLRGVVNSGRVLSGDFPEINSDFALDDIPEGSTVGMAMTPFIMQSIVDKLEGGIATGSDKILVGDETTTNNGMEFAQGLTNNAGVYPAVDGMSVLVKLADGSSFTVGAGAGTIIGGDGIDVTASEISVDLATDSGLEIDTAKLQVKTTGAITKGASGLDVDESGLTYASQAEAEAGTATDKPLNALRTKQAIDANASSTAKHKTGSFSVSYTSGSASSGTESITGIGFEPTFVQIWANTANNTADCEGFSDGTFERSVYFSATTTRAINTSKAIYLDTNLGSSNADYDADISMTADGFDIEWDVPATGSTSGSASISFHAICFK